MITQLIKSEQCITMYDVSWEELEAFTPLAERNCIHLTYLDGILDLMTPSPEHEEYKTTIGLLIETYFRVFKIRFYGCGSPTLGSKELGTRGEPDESYNIGTKKPIPDLAIEVTITSVGVDKLEKYRRWGVKEVWFWNTKTLKVYYLESTKYQQVVNSVLLPSLDLELLVRCLQMPDQYDATSTFSSALTLTIWK